MMDTFEVGETATVKPPVHGRANLAGLVIDIAHTSAGPLYELRTSLGLVWCQAYELEKR